MKRTQVEATLAATLEEALQSHDLSIPAEQMAQLQEYATLLWGWNEKLNLTRHLDYETFVGRDVIDSMQLAECFEAGENVLDVGSGGGVPGIVVAILRPDIKMTVSDSIEKKTKALDDMVQKLELKTHVINSRIQDLLPKQKFDTLVARAVGPTSKILRWVQPHWTNFHRLLLIKGPRWVDERGDARHHGLLKSLDLRKVKSYPMPGTKSESVILSITRKGN